VPSITKRNEQRLDFTFGHRSFVGHSSVRGEDVMWWSNLPREKELTKVELNDLSVEAVKNNMRSICRGYHEPIEILLAHTRPAVKLNLFDIQTLST
jgi:hypothetical protein